MGTTAGGGGPRLGKSRRRAARVDAVRRIPPGRRPPRTQRARSTRRRRAGGAAGDAARYRVGDDRLPLPRPVARRLAGRRERDARRGAAAAEIGRATSELQSLMRISYAVFCLKKKKTIK